MCGSYRRSNPRYRTLLSLCSERTRPSLRRQIEWAEVMVFQGYLLSKYPWVAKTDTIIVADVYDPMHLEYLEQGKDESPTTRGKRTEYISEVLNVQLERADFILCASEKQRDFWLGQLAAVSRINPHSYDADPSLRSLIDVAPFGISYAPAVQTRHAIKGIVPGIGVDDQVILWGGGVYNWFDPLTLIRAVKKLVERHPQLRLYFLGVRNTPTPTFLRCGWPPRPCRSRTTSGSLAPTSSSTPTGWTTTTE